MRTLVKLMLREEFRMHTSHSSRAMFFTFPFLVTVFSLAAAVTYEN
jgi:hypothetical protein